MAVSKSIMGLSAIGGGGAIEFLKPDVAWVLNGFPAPRPDSVDQLVSAALVLGGLVLWHWLTHKDPALISEVSGDVTVSTEVAKIPSQEN